MRNLSFGEAINAVQCGELIAREGWNGKGMFVFMRPNDSLDTSFVIRSVKSLPQAFKRWLALHSDEISKVNFTPYLCMKAADNTIVNGWLASQTDILANDWQVLDI